MWNHMWNGYYEFHKNLKWFTLLLKYIYIFQYKGYMYFFGTNIFLPITISLLLFYLFITWVMFYHNTQIHCETP
jgi:hypothetical protein